MVLSLRAESKELDPTMVVWDKFMERFSESMRKLTDQLAESLKQAYQKSEPKHNRRVLICGYTQEDDCLCVATESMEPEYDENDDLGEVVLDCEEEDVNQIPLQNQPLDPVVEDDGDLFVHEAKDHKILQETPEDSSPPVHPFHIQFIHGKVSSLHSEFSSPSLSANTTIGKIGKNEMEFRVADNVFGKSPKRSGSTACLNPKPPDFYVSLGDLIDYGINASAQLKAEDSITALLEVLDDPVQPLKDANLIEQQQLVAKQMHAVVVLYNYFVRKRHSELDFLGFDSFCKLAVNLRPSMNAHMKFMHQSDYKILDDLENQLSLTKMAIMDACKLCLALDVSNNVLSIEEWPISKVAVVLIDYSNKNCALVFSSVTLGVWSVLEKGLDIRHISLGSTLVRNRRNIIKKKDLGNLVARCNFFVKHKLVWEVLDNGLKNKIKIQWSDIMALKVTYSDDEIGTLDVVLARQFFFRETNPQPRKHTLRQAEISLESPNFETRIYVFNESDEAYNDYVMNYFMYHQQTNFRNEEFLAEDKHQAKLLKEPVNFQLQKKCDEKKLIMWRYVIQGSSFVFHLDDGDFYRDDFFLCYTVIVQGEKNVINACQECKVKRHIYNSTTDVFEGSQYIHDGDESLPHAWKFDNMLGDLKAPARTVVLFDNDIDYILTCVVHLSSVFGFGDKQFAPFLIDIETSGWAKLIIGSGEIISDVTYMDNVAHALVCTDEALNSQMVSISEKVFFITNVEPTKF